MYVVEHSKINVTTQGSVYVGAPATACDAISLTYAALNKLH